MPQEDDPVLIYTTFAGAGDAATLGRKLVEERLAACVNIIPGMTSVYEWQGELHEDGEVVMLVKTRKGRLDEALKRARALHSYDTPALLVLEPAGADADFAAWIAAQTGVPAK